MQHGTPGSGLILPLARRRDDMRTPQTTKDAMPTAGSPIAARRGPITLAAALLLVVLGAGACGGGGDGDVSESPAPVAYRGMILADPLPKPDFTLEDTSGERFDFKKETEGYITLLYFGYTNCPDVCPTHMANLAAGLEDAPEDVRERVKVVFVSVDPERDTLDRLRTWLDIFDESFIGLRGDIAEIDAIQQEALGPFAFTIERQELEGGGCAVSHSALVFAYTTDGEAHLAYPSGVYKEDWTNDLTQLVKKGWIEP